MVVLLQTMINHNDSLDIRIPEHQLLKKLRIADLSEAVLDSL
jgi:hypothetical protein